MALLSDKALDLRFDELIEDGDRERIQHCAYMLLPDRVFATTTDSRCNATQLGPVCYRIEPGALVWIRTKEIVKVPEDLCGIWSQTNHYAQRGLMLINASIVEPGYRGPLTGALVNFGQTARVITPIRPFARIMYASLDGRVEKPLRMNMERAVYDSHLLEILEDAPATFLNLGSLHKDLVEIVKETMGGQERQLETMTSRLEAQLEVKVDAKLAQANIGIDAKAEATTQNSLVQLTSKGDKVIAEFEAKKTEIISDLTAKVIKPVNALLFGAALVGLLVGALHEVGFDAWVAKRYFEPVDLKARVDQAVEQSLGRKAIIGGVAPSEFEALRVKVDQLSARVASSGISSGTGQAAPPGSAASGSSIH